MTEGDPAAPAAKPASSRPKAARPRAARAQAGVDNPPESPAKPAARSGAAGAAKPAARSGAAGAAKPAAKSGAAKPAAKPARRPAKASRPPTRAWRAGDGPATPAGVIGPGGDVAGYHIEAQIGEGGMAVVYRAGDERLGRRVALKLLAPGLAADTEFRNRFIRESRAAAAVDHPNIIPIYEAGDAGGVLFIAMRFVEGGDVGSLLRREGPLAAGRAWDIISQVAEALDAAHERGLIHRDVKPANMLLDIAVPRPDGASRSPARHEHVYLSDFGISKQSLAARTLTASGQFVGTLDYIAPEQIEGPGMDGRADQYSLGCAAFELLSGEPPFRRGRGLALISAHLTEQPPALTAQRPDLPAAVDGVLAAAMAKSADERYPTCAQFAVDLGRALGLLPGEAQPPGGAQPSSVAQHPASAPPPATVAIPQPSAAPPQPVGPAGPYDPYGAYPPAAPPPRRRSRGLRFGLLILAVAAALAAGAAVAVLVANHGRSTSSSPPSPTPTAAAGSPTPSRSPSPSARAEAVAISNLLATGANSSTTLTYAAGNVQSCTSLARSFRQIQQVRDQRQAEYEQAQKLSTGTLANGSQLKASLVQSLLDSLTADNDYLSWAQQQAGSCQPGSQPSAALAADQQAVRDKTTFVQMWNVVAAQYGLAPASVGRI